MVNMLLHGLPRWLSGKNSACQCRRCKRLGFHPWSRKIPWSRKWLTPVFLPGKFYGQRSLAGYSPWGYKVGHDWARARARTHTHTHRVLYLSNTPNSSLNIRTSDPQRVTFYKVSDQYSLIWSRPSRTRKIWNTVTAKSSLRRHHNYM